MAVLKALMPVILSGVEGCGIRAFKTASNNNDCQKRA